MMIICVMTDRSFYHKEWWFCRTLTVSFKSLQTKEAINHQRGILVSFYLLCV